MAFDMMGLCCTEGVEAVARCRWECSAQIRPYRDQGAFPLFVLECVGLLLC